MIPTVTSLVVILPYLETGESSTGFKFWDQYLENALGWYRSQTCEVILTLQDSFALIVLQRTPRVEKRKTARKVTVLLGVRVYR